MESFETYSAVQPSYSSEHDYVSQSALISMKNFLKLSWLSLFARIHCTVAVATSVTLDMCSVLAIEFP